MSEAKATPKQRSGSQTRQKTHAVTTGYDAEEYAELCEAASKAGLTLASYQRVQSLASPKTRSTRRPPVEKELLARTLGQLNKIGSNLNQVAHAAHLDRPDLDELRRVLAMLEPCLDAVMEAMGRKIEGAAETAKPEAAQGEITRAPENTRIPERPAAPEDALPISEAVTPPAGTKPQPAPDKPPLIEGISDGRATVQQRYDHASMMELVAHAKVAWPRGFQLPADPKTLHEFRLRLRAYADVYGLDFDDLGDAVYPLTPTELATLPGLQADIRAADPSAPPPKPEPPRSGSVAIQPPAAVPPLYGASPLAQGDVWSKPSPGKEGKP